MGFDDGNDQIALGHSPLGLPFFTVLRPARLEEQPKKVCRYRIRRRARKRKKQKARAKFVACGKTPRQHKTVVDVLMTMIRLVHRWLPERTKVLVVDGGYAAL